MFYKIEGGGNLSSKAFNGSFISLIFKQGQWVALHAQVLSIVIDGVDQAVTGGSLRHRYNNRTFVQCWSRQRVIDLQESLISNAHETLKF